MTRTPFLPAMLAATLGACLCAADDGSARRYAGFEIDTDVYCTFSLLERKAVQDELKLTPEQIAKIKDIWRGKEQDIPGLQELLDRSKKLNSAPAISDADRKKQNMSFWSQFGKLTEAYQGKELSATLSGNQRQRLNELLAQMRGPMIILDDPAIASRLGLSDKQRAKMAEIVKDFEADNLGWLRRRYGRQQFAGIGPGETMRGREEEVQALFVLIRTQEKQRDHDLLCELTPDQLTSWRKIQGQPFPIAWPLRGLGEYPFNVLSEDEVGDAPIPAENEVVMSPGMKITAETPKGKITITAGKGLKRSYTWEGATRSVEMWPRAKRWYGSLGLYYPGPGEHWKEHKGITRAVVAEGQQHFKSVEEFRKWLADRNWIPLVYSDDGLVVGWKAADNTLHVEVWQIYINGMKPVKLDGSQNDKVQTGDGKAPAARTESSTKLPMK